MKNVKRPRSVNWLARAGGAIARWLAPTALALASAAALAGPPRDRLTLLIPDDADPSSWQVQVWTDSAAEEGVRLDVLRDSAFLALGANAASTIAGLVVPDSAHLKASDAVVAAIKRYAFTGGKLMLVYDAGSLTDAGFYPLTGNSRFGDMVGLEYVLWDNGLGAGSMVGFGQVIGTKARLQSLSIPPGKYLPYVPPATLTSTTAAAAFAPTSRLDPGAAQVMRDTIRARHRAIEDGSSSVRRMRPRALRDVLGVGIEASGPLRFAKRIGNASAAREMHIYDRAERPSDFEEATLSSSGSSAIDANSVATYSAQDASLQAISGYGYGPLGYFHYVTTGTFPGTVMLSSPEHGLVAGLRAYGSGKLLFVNMPLGYFKAMGTDSAPIQGFLGHFAREQVGIATLSVQPRGQGGLIYNWHIDDGDDLTTYARMLLDQTTVFNRGPFSIHLTAGPDVITFGDGNGINLPASGAAQDLLRRLDNVGKYASSRYRLPVQHEIGSHGGWIHDYWATMAREDNVPDLKPLLKQNFDAIEAVTGQKIREYSSPAGNTPTWAVKWLEDRGVVGMYLVGDGGAAAVRSWRNGARLTDKMWTIPVTPQGKYATFEEFDEFDVTDATTGQWLIDLQSFVVNRHTNRMFYNHPPGAADHLKPITALLTRGDRLQAQGKFRWYTMARIADFSQARLATTWNTTSQFGITTFAASHPTALDDVTWLLPRGRYYLPWVWSGRASVSADKSYWIVTAESGTSLRFSAFER